MSIRSLPAELQKVAIDELNEVPERIADDIEVLRTWIKQQPHLRARRDAQWLLAFLRGCKFSLEKAKLKIDKFYALRTKYADTFSYVGVDLEKSLEILRLGVIFYLPTPLHDNGPRIGIMRMGAFNADALHFKDIVRITQLINDITLLEDDYANVNGVVHICDFANVTGQHLLQMSPTLMKKMTVFSEDAMPLRPKSNHCINTPAGFLQLFNVLRPMLSKKQQGRLFMHGSNMELLHEQIPKKYLPAEYGGKNGTIRDGVAHWEKRIIDYKSYFADEKNFGTDEKLRPGKPIDYDNIFGVEGSFRQLNVD